MPTLRQRPDTGSWEVSWYEFGRRIRLSCESKARAKDLKREVERKVLLLKAGIASSSAASAGARTRFRDWAEEYLDGPAKEKASLRRDQIIVNTHLVPFFGALYLIAINEADAEAYRRHRVGKKVGPATINRELALLKHLLRLAGDQGLLLRVPKIRLAKELRTEHRRALTPDEQKALFVAAEKELVPLLVLGFACGLRPAELTALRWQDVDLAGRRVIVDNRPDEEVRTKTGRMRALPLEPEAVEALLPYRGAPGDRVSPWAKLRDPWRRALKKAGLPRTVTPYYMRHTFVSRLFDARRDFRTIQRLAGHSAVQTTMRYAHGSVERDRAAVEGAGLLPPLDRHSEPDGTPADDTQHIESE